MGLDRLSKYRSELYGFSILWIMLFHGIVVVDISYATSNIFGWAFTGFMTYGNMGCEIFFICSGMSLYFSYVKNKDLGDYAKKRLVRLIIPVLLVNGWFWIVFQGIIKGDFFGTFSRLTLMELFVGGNSQIWFVSAILIFYLLYPFIFEFFFGKKSSYGYIALKMAILIAIIVILTFAFKAKTPDYYKQIEIALTRLPSFIFGAFIGKAVYEKRKLPVWVWISAFAYTVLSFIALYKDWIPGSIWRRYFYGFAGLALTLSLVALFAIPHIGAIRKFFAFFGKMSINFYLLHTTIIYLWRMTPLYENRTTLQYLILIGVCVPLAMIVEKLTNIISAAILHKNRL